MRAELLLRPKAVTSAEGKMCDIGPIFGSGLVRDKPAGPRLSMHKSRYGNKVLQAQI